MTRVVPAPFVLGLSLYVAACSGGSSSPTAPTTPTVPTRIISVSGDLAFGNVNIGQAPTRTFTISNSGNAMLTFTGMSAAGGTGAAGYAVSPTSGSVAPGGMQTVTVRFTPVVAQFYSAVLTVNADQTSGGNAINVTGTGVNNTPLFTRSGTGDTVFDMPASVTRIRITGRFTGNGQNFIVRIAGRLIVNELLGTGFGSTTFDGTYVTSGGVVEITSSSGVAWSFTEVR